MHKIWSMYRSVPSLSPLESHNERSALLWIFSCTSFSEQSTTVCDEDKTREQKQCDQWHNQRDECERFGFIGVEYVIFQQHPMLSQHFCSVRHRTRMLHDNFLSLHLNEVEMIVCESVFIPICDRHTNLHVYFCKVVVRPYSRASLD